MLVHLDTDLGGDTDDACALALLLGQDAGELAGVHDSCRPGRTPGWVRPPLPAPRRPRGRPGDRGGRAVDDHAAVR